MQQTKIPFNDALRQMFWRAADQYWNEYERDPAAFGYSSFSDYFHKEYGAIVHWGEVLTPNWRKDKRDTFIFVDNPEKWSWFLLRWS